MFRSIVQRWKAVLFGLCLYLLLLGYSAHRVRGLGRANERIALAMEPTSPPPKEPAALTVLRKENDRLKSDLASLAELKQAVQRLTQKMAAEQRKSQEHWGSRSNELQIAIERERGEINELRQWANDWTRLKMREAAQARLIERAAMNLDPAKERERLGIILREITLTSKERMKLQEAWREGSDKSPEARNAFLAKLQEINARWLKATQELGPDSPLYEQMPVKPSEQDPKAVFFRSVIPDSQGVSGTIYFDGTASWTTSQ